MPGTRNAAKSASASGGVDDDTLKVSENSPDTNAQEASSNTSGTTLESIELSIKALHEKVDGIRNEHNTVKGSVDTLTTSVQKQHNDISTCKDDTASMKGELDMLRAVVIKQSIEIDELKSQMMDMQTRSMSLNVLFHNIPENKNENCKDSVCDILKKQGYTGTYTFDKIHRLGVYNQGNTRPRPIIAKLINHQETSALLKFGSELSKKKPAPQLKITPQFPAELREKRKRLGEIATKVREKDRNTTTKIISGTLYVNGEKHVENVTRPTVEQILLMDEGEKQEAARAKFKDSSKVEGGSSFVVRAASADSINDVRALYKAILSNPWNAQAHHNSLGYSLFTPLGARTTDGYCDDGEHGMGRFIRDTLHELNAKNIVIFVTRRFGGKHLGSKRFEVVKELISSVVTKLNDTQ